MNTVTDFIQVDKHGYWTKYWKDWTKKCHKNVFRIQDLEEKQSHAINLLRIWSGNLVCKTDRVCKKIMSINILFTSAKLNLDSQNSIMQTESGTVYKTLFMQSDTWTVRIHLHNLTLEKKKNFHECKQH